MAVTMAMTEDTPPSDDDILFLRAQRHYTPERVREILEHIPHGFIRKPLREGEAGVKIKRQKNTRAPHEDQMVDYAAVKWALAQLDVRTREIVVAIYAYRWSCYRYADKIGWSHMTVNRHAVKGTEDMAILLGYQGKRKRPTLH